jgi:hypothetical protein
MKNNRPDQADQKQKLRVLFDSGCGAKLINKKFVRHWKKQKANPLSGLPKVVASKQKGNVKSNLHYQPSIKTGISTAMLM